VEQTFSMGGRRKPCGRPAGLLSTWANVEDYVFETGAIVERRENHSSAFHNTNGKKNDMPLDIKKKGKPGPGGRIDNKARSDRKAGRKVLPLEEEKKSPGGKSQGW